MSTRSLIAITQTDGTVKSIYCHWDGYVSHNGRLLIEHYATPEAVEELLALGPLSTLREHPAPPPGTHHTYDQPQRDVTIAYHRDRGEPYRPPHVWPNESEMLAKASEEYWADYCYLFRDGKWYIDDACEPSGWREVAEVLKENEKEDATDE